MSTIRVVLAASLLVIAGGPARAAPGDGTVGHAIVVELDPGEHRIDARNRIELPASLRVAGTIFTLNGSLVVRESDPPVVRLGEDERGDVRYALDAAAESGVLEIDYGGRFDFGLADEKEQYTRGFRDTRGIVGSEGVYLDGGSRWVPRFGDGLIRFRVEVRAPAGWHVISQGNGTSGDGDGHATWESGGAMEQVYLVGGPLVVERDTAGAVETLVYLHERDDALSRKYLDATSRYIEMYRAMLGTYPYEKFALIENFWETGYGMPSFTLLGPQVIRFPFILHSSYPHEILHNWWGNSVFVASEGGNWCEGLTAYLADHLIKEQRGQGAEYRRDALRKYRDYVREGRDFPLSAFESRHSAATEAVGYGKALMLFHMVRLRIGDDAFRTALAGFYRKQRGRRASFDDLRASFEAAGQVELGDVFVQWVERTGAPTLAVRDIDVRSGPDGFTVTGTLLQLQDDEPFALDVPVRVRSEAGSEHFVVETDTRSRTFELTAAHRPLSLDVDPSFDLFRQLDPRETPPSIGQIFGEPRVLAVLPAGADPVVLEGYRQLVGAWRSDAHEIESVLDSSIDDLPDDRPAWILGRENRFAGMVTQGDGVVYDASSRTLALAGEATPIDDHSFVVVRRHPRDVARAIGWIAVDPPVATAGMVRKLPHYGKYSYLAFEGDEPTNVVKGQWDVSDSPLTVDLRGDRNDPMPSAADDPRAPLAELPPVFSRRALMEHVTWLAAPEREGRGLGSAGLESSARYIAERMESAGLEPGGDGGTWFQRFTVPNGPDEKPVEAVNVIGVLPGTRADWRDQSVVLCAHYDHLGLGWPDAHAGDEGKIHPGADDNASGVAVMLELAGNLVAEGGRSRDLVVLASSAEECGRWGSRHYLEHPTRPADGIRAAVNLDTVGRLGGGAVAVHGTGTADEWPHVFRGCSFVTGVPSRNVPGAYEGSDQASFIERGIPAVQVFTGAHGDYHRPTDTIDRVDGAGLVKIATFVKEAVVYLLEREAPLAARIDGTASRPAPAGGGGGRRVLFGTVPEFAYQGEGVQVASLVPGSPAERAGLRAGDVLVRLGDREIGDLRGFSEALKTLAPGDEVEAEVQRGEDRVIVRVVVTAR